MSEGFIWLITTRFLNDASAAKSRLITRALARRRTSTLVAFCWAAAAYLAGPSQCSFVTLIPIIAILGPIVPGKGGVKLLAALGTRRDEKETITLSGGNRVFA